jgi:hypothetical protein
MSLCSITPSGFVRYFVLSWVLIQLLKYRCVNPDAQNVVNALCLWDASLTVEDCFGTNDDAKYQVTDLSQDWRLWVFQYCTQWGYLTVRLSIYPPFFDVNKIYRRPHRLMASPRSSRAFWISTTNTRFATRPSRQESITGSRHCRTLPL